MTTGFLTLVDLLGVAVSNGGCDQGCVVLGSSSALGATGDESGVENVSSVAGDTGPGSGVCTWTWGSGLTGVMGCGGVCSSGNMGTTGCSDSNPGSGIGGVEDWGPGTESKLRPGPFS